MVLVFSFGFLVYRKMDMHQQRLTQASIGAQGDAAAAAGDGAVLSADGDPLAAANSGTQASPFADPFGNAPAGASAGSVDSLQEATAEGSAASEPLFAFNEPPQEISGPGSVQDAGTEPGFVFPADAGQAQAGQPQQTNPLAPGDLEPLVLMGEGGNAATPQDSRAAESSSEGTEAVIAFPEPAVAAPTDGLNAAFVNDGANAATAEFPAVAEPLQETVISEPSVAGQPFELESIDVGAQVANAAASVSGAAPEFPLESAAGGPAQVRPGNNANAVEGPALTGADAAAETRGDQGTTLESAAAGSEDLAGLVANEPDSNDAGTLPVNSGSGNLADSSDQEPVLIAMAEPQQSGDFSGGFTPEPATVEAGVESPRESFPAQATQTNSGGGSLRTFGQPSAGFNAVTRPSNRTGGNVMRNAAGSGADGKFSLAAFNYQNGAAAAAAEDGSTHESVVVQPGENYSKISRRVYGTARYFSALAVFNQHRIPDPIKMRPGMIVLTPEVRVLEERYPQLFIDQQPKVREPAMFMVLEDGSPAYRVGERETLSEISKRFLGRSSRWVEIYQMNQSAVKDPNKLKPGIILALPEDATEVNVIP